VSFVVDDKEGKGYSGVSGASLIFSPDSQRMVYGASIGNKWFAVTDGREGKHYDTILEAGLPVFSPDSHHVAYAAVQGRNQFVVVDEMEGKPFEQMLSGSRIIFDFPDRLHYLVVRGNTVYLINEVIK